VYINLGKLAGWYENEMVELVGKYSGKDTSSCKPSNGAGHTFFTTSSSSASYATSEQLVVKQAFVVNSKIDHQNIDWLVA
jgi:hypothetical protein